MASQLSAMDNHAETLNINTPSTTVLITIHATLVIMTLLFLFITAPYGLLVSFLALAPVMLAIAAHGYAYGLLQVRDHATPENLTRLIRRLSLALSAFIGIMGSVLLNIMGVNGLGPIVIWLIPIAFAISLVGNTKITSQGLRLFLMTAPLYIMMISTIDPALNWMATLLGLGNVLALLTTLAIRQRLAEQATKITQTSNAFQVVTDRLNGFLDHKTDWSWISNNEHQFIFLSENIDRATGDVIKLSDTQVKPVSELTLTKLLEKRHLEQFLEAFEDGRKFSGLEIKIIPQTGEPRWFSLMGKPIISDDGKISGYNGWAFDITPTVAAREKQKSYQTVLENKIRHRTKSLESDFAKIEKKLREQERLSKRQEILTASMLKHLENPINKVSDNAANINDPALKTSITQASKTLMRMITNIPYILSINNQSYSDTHQIVNLDDITRAAIYDLEASLIHTKTSLVLQELSGVQIFGDTKILEKALYELLHTTIHNAPAHSRITLGIICDDAGVHFMSKDQSPVLPNQTTKHLETILSGQDISPTTILDLGDDAGLLIAAGLLRSHNAHISVDRNTDNNGNLLSVHFPKARLLKLTA